MSNKPGKKKKIAHLKMWQKILKQEQDARKQAAAYLETSEYQFRLNKEMAWKWIFIILFLLSMAGNVWQFVRNKI